MKKSSLKLLTIVLTLMLVMTFLALSSCSSTRSTNVVQQNDSVSSFVNSQAIHKDLLLEKEKIHDSIVYREKVVHDTVYVTKEVYRDSRKWNVESLKSMKTDTVLVTEYRDRVVELPPERYVPKFYKWCTGLLWAIGLLAVGYWALKRWLCVV